MGCLGENTVLAFAEGIQAADSRAAVEAHARNCPHCQDLIAAVALNLPRLSRTALTERARPAFAPASVPQGDASASFADAPLTPGTSIGRYTILGLVGRGGMGEVYAAYDPSLDRRVALKVMSSRSTMGEDRAHQRLLREAQVTAKLSHQNVVVVHEVGTFEGQTFIAMEFVDGLTLGAWLAERPRTWRETLAMFVQAARGLGAAHAEGLVHRDFKPQNVMVSKSGVARVMDFGLARRIDERQARPAEGSSSERIDESLTNTGELLGTPLYMAPEQFVWGRVDARTDQFSFCVALYWALCGVHPFGGNDRAELARNAARGQVVPPSKRVAAPTRVLKALARGLSPDPDARWPSMDALVSELLRDPASHRRRLGWVALAVLVVVAVGLSTGYLSQRSRALCSAGPDHLAGVWEIAERAGPSSYRERVRATVLTSGVAEPAQAWSGISSLLDRYAAKWVAAYRDACEATHIRGEQSEEMLDLRMTCLADNLDSARAFTQLLSSGDRAVIDHAAEAAGSLGDLTRCGAAEQMRSAPRPPRDPMIRKAVEEARRQLKDAETLRLAGETKRATAIADGVLARPEIVSYCPVEAEALFLKGMVDNEVGADRGVTLLERAVNTAERCGHDRVVAGGLASLAFLDRVTDWAASERELGLATAALARLGGDPLLESWIANNLGALRDEQGRYEEAYREMRRALELKRGVLDGDSLDLAGAYSNISELLVKLGRFDEALSAAREGLRIDTKMNAGGGPTGIGLNNQGEALAALGRLDEAKASFTEASAVFQARAAEDHPSRWDTDLGLAVIRLQQGDAEGAIPMFEQVLADQQKRGTVATRMAQTQFKVAVALDRAHRDPLRARQLARQAAAAFATEPMFEAQRREVEAWLQERGGATRSVRGLRGG
jgi:tetratricopeptide (TPR) repeat protein